MRAGSLRCHRGCSPVEGGGEGTRVSRQTFCRRGGEERRVYGEIAVHLRRRKVVVRCGEAREWWKVKERGGKKGGKKERRDGERALSKRRVISLAMTSNTIQRRTSLWTSNLVHRCSLRQISQYGTSGNRSLTPKGIIREDLFTLERWFVDTTLGRNQRNGWILFLLGFLFFYPCFGNFPSSFFVSIIFLLFHSWNWEILLFKIDRFWTAQRNIYSSFKFNKVREMNSLKSSIYRSMNRNLTKKPPLEITKHMSIPAQRGSLDRVQRSSLR